MDTHTWTPNGHPYMELRPTYYGGSQSSAEVQESARRMAEAKQMVDDAAQMVAAAARVLGGARGV
jgi:hypothetical protein